MVGGVVLPLRGPTNLAVVPGLPASGGGLAPCWASLPGKGGPSLADILLLWLDLGPSELHVGSSNLLVLQSLTQAGASILFLCLSVHESGENAYPCIFSLTYLKSKLYLMKYHWACIAFLH